MKTYTVIYLESFMCGSHRNTLTQMVYVNLENGEPLGDKLNQMGIYGDVVYCFEGEIKPITNFL